MAARQGVARSMEARLYGTPIVFGSARSPRRTSPSSTTVAAEGSTRSEWSGPNPRWGSQSGAMVPVNKGRVNPALSLFYGRGWAHPKNVWGSLVFSG